MFRIARLAVVALAMGLTVWPALAQVPARAGSALTAAGRDWLSVGRLDLVDGGFCTVTLIADDRALTAAHCLVDTRTGGLHAISDMTVRLGLREGRAEVVRGVTAALPVDPSAVTGMRAAEQTSALVARDLAVLVLDRAVRLAHVAPIALSPTGPEDAQSLTVVSYARGRSERAEVQGDCLLIGAQPDGALILDCVVDHGASGAPVMAAGGAGPRIVAVVSARGQLRRAGFPDAQVALAAPVTGSTAEALARALAVAAPPSAGVRVRRAGAAEGVAEAGGGARRVRVHGDEAGMGPVTTGPLMR